MKIFSDHIFLDILMETKEDLFTFLAQNAQHLGITDTPEELYLALLKREQEISTGLQDGFAIPHAKSSAIISPSLLFVNLKKPLLWKTFDHSDVRYVLCLLIPEENTSRQHLEMLSKLAVCLMDKPFRDRLKAAENRDILAQTINIRMEQQQ